MKRRWAARLGLTLSLSLLAVSEAGMTRAQSRTSLDGITAEALFDEGVRLMDAQQYSPACPKLQLSYELDPGIGTLLYLGDCYRFVGKTASAWMAFRRAAFAAAEAEQPEREQMATDLANSLRPKLVLLQIETAPLPPGAKLALDGQRLSSELVNVRFAVDPGKHELSVVAPGWQPWSQALDLADEPGIVPVRVPPLIPVPARADSSVGLPAPEQTARDAPGLDVLDSLGWALLGAGATAGLVGGGTMAFGDDERAGIALTAGGVLGLGAGTLLLLRPWEVPVSVGATVASDGAGLVAGGTF